jgi:hypothetical protein
MLLHTSPEDFLLLTVMTFAVFCNSLTVEPNVNLNLIAAICVVLLPSDSYAFASYARE